MQDTEKSLFNTEISRIINSNKPITFINVKNTNLENNRGINKTLLFIIFIICVIQIILIIFLFNKRKEYKNKYLKIKEKKFGLGYDDMKKSFLYKEDENKANYTNKLEVHISMSLDNNGIYPTLVSMTSALDNNNKDKNILVYHLLLSHDFNTSEIEKFESLKQNYNFKINYYIIPNIFGNIEKYKGTDTIYYKLLIPILLSHLERIIFLDGDTLIFKDISEMYKLPFGNNYILGYPFHTPYTIDKFGIKSQYYINGRVLLINIKEIRKKNEDINLLEYTIKNYGRTVFFEQDTLNYIYYNKIGFLPFKYGIYLYGDFEGFKKNYYNKYRVKLNLTEIENAIEDPSIVHLCCCNPKVWNRASRHEKKNSNICEIYQKKFYYYAKKTDYYSEIYNKLY